MNNSFTAQNSTARFGNELVNWDTITKPIVFVNNGALFDGWQRTENPPSIERDVKPQVKIQKLQKSEELSRSLVGEKSPVMGPPKYFPVRFYGIKKRKLDSKYSYYSLNN